MRRPTPLPPSAPRPDGRLAPPSPESPGARPGRASATTAATLADEQETAPIAPIVAFPSPSGDRTPSLDDAVVAPGADAVGVDEPADSGPPAAKDPGPTGPVRMRDVWRASRARRRALRAEMRRFTARQRRRRMLWLGAAASLALVAAATVGAAYSPLFAVETVDVVGAQQLAAADVVTALAGQVGTPLAAIDESAVKAALVRFPLIESYSLEARPPHDLVVRIVERTPIGLIRSDAGYTVVDAAGVALSTSADAPAGYPVIETAGGAGSAAFQAAGRVMRALPDELRGQVTRISATTADDVTLTLDGTSTQVVWGSAEQSALKALTLQRMMAARPGMSSYDVSSPYAVVVR